MTVIYVPCSACNGLGDKGWPPRECKRCDGTGTVVQTGSMETTMSDTRPAVGDDA